MNKIQDNNATKTKIVKDDTLHLKKTGKDEKGNDGLKEDTNLNDDEWDESRESDVIQNDLNKIINTEGNNQDPKSP